MSGAAYKLVGLIDGTPETSVYSSLDGPIESLSMLRRSLLFAELANLSYLSRAEAGLITERDKRGDAARMRNGCTQTAGGAIAVAGPRRAAAPGAASRAYLPWAHVPARRRGPRRAALTMILAEPAAIAAARTIQSSAGRACRVVLWQPGTGYREG